jgi:hypothetical protein
MCSVRHVFGVLGAAQLIAVSECANTVSFRQSTGIPSYYAAHAIFLPLTGAVVNSMAPLEWAGMSSSSIPMLDRH